MTDNTEQENVPEVQDTPKPNFPKNKYLPEDPLAGVKAAEFPQGFWKRLDYMLHNPDHILVAIKQDKDLLSISRVCFQISLAMCILYGTVMGSTNFLQGSVMAVHGKMLMIITTAIKVPILYLLTFAIVLPPIYVSNAFVGAKLSFRQMLAALMSSLAVTVTVLSSMATVALFFSLTSKSYEFLKLLHVLFFVYAGLAGLTYLKRCISVIMPPSKSPKELFVLWLVLYMFVGTQLAWVLRPFVGSPGSKYQLFRPREGNFYEDVIDSMGAMTQEWGHRK